jgi:hypothetical protein
VAIASRREFEERREQHKRTDFCDGPHRYREGLQPRWPDGPFGDGAPRPATLDVRELDAALVGLQREYRTSTVSGGGRGRV